MNEHEDIMELKEAAKSHVTWTIFWAIFALYTLITASILGFIINEKTAEHNKLESRISLLENKANESTVAYATIQTQLVQIQKDLSELKVAVAKSR